jgi:hypothetical protein
MQTTRIGDQESHWEQAQRLLQELDDYVCGAVGRDELHEVEHGVFRRLQQLGRVMMERFVAASGTGYTPGRPPCTRRGEPLSYKGIESVDYLSIFGQIGLPRAAYAQPDGGYEYPMDGQWNRPAHKYSYLLQKWLQAVAVEDDYHEAAARLNEIFDLSLMANVGQRLGGEVAAGVGPYYQQRDEPPADTEGSHLGISADGKGVRILRRERGQLTGDEEPPAKPRLGKGEKPGTKKEAVVTADFTFDPEARDPEELVRDLMKRQTPEEREAARRQRRARRQEGLPPPRAALNKHVRATLKGKRKAFGDLMARVRRRDPAGHKPVVALFDGDGALDDMLQQQLRAHGLSGRLEAMVLDIWHASEYVWEVGTALHGERNPQREVWVEDKLRALLHSKVGRVIGGLKQIATKNRLTAAQAKAVRKAVTYFENHRHMMDYASYLAKGYPIGTGQIEGACGCLVRDRLENSGMRWSLAGAQAILEQRAVKLNGDWHDFWSYYSDTERDRLYPATYTLAA